MRRVDVDIESFHHVLHHAVVGHFAGQHRDIGLGIDRMAHLHQCAHGRLRILGLEQRARVAFAHTSHQHVEVGLEPDRDGPLGDPRPRRLAHEGAAAGGQHHRPLAQQTRDHPLLALAKTRLAVDRENVGDGELGRRLDLVVGILEHQPEAPGEAAPDGALARPHQADEHDRPGSEAAAQSCFDRFAGRRRRRQGDGHRAVIDGFAEAAKRPVPPSAPSRKPHNLGLTAIQAGFAEKPVPRGVAKCRSEGKACTRARGTAPLSIRLAWSSAPTLVVSVPGK